MVYFHLAAVALLYSVNVMALPTEPTNSTNIANPSKMQVMPEVNWTNVPACSTVDSHPYDSIMWNACQKAIKDLKESAKGAEKKAETAAGGKDEKAANDNDEKSANNADKREVNSENASGSLLTEVSGEKGNVTDEDWSEED